MTSAASERGSHARQLMPRTPRRIPRYGIPQCGRDGKAGQRRETSFGRLQAAVHESVDFAGGVAHLLQALIERTVLAAVGDLLTDGVLNVVNGDTIEALVVLSDDVVDNAIDDNITLGDGDDSLLMTTIERWPA